MIEPLVGKHHCRDLPSVPRRASCEITGILHNFTFRLRRRSLRRKYDNLLIGLPASRSLAKICQMDQNISLSAKSGLKSTRAILSTHFQLDVEREGQLPHYNLPTIMGDGLDFPSFYSAAASRERQILVPLAVKAPHPPELAQLLPLAPQLFAKPGRHVLDLMIESPNELLVFLLYCSGFIVHLCQGVATGGLYAKVLQLGASMQRCCNWGPLHLRIAHVFALRRSNSSKRRFLEWGGQSNISPKTKLHSDSAVI